MHIGLQTFGRCTTLSTVCSPSWASERSEATPRPGFAEVYESSVLWTVPPKATFIMTGLAYLPLCAVIWRAAPLPPRTQKSSGGKKVSLAAADALCRANCNFLHYVSLGCAVAFCFGWHVHEKAILQITVPLLAAAASGDRSFATATAALSLVGTFSILPLMPNRPIETYIKWGLLLIGHLVEVCILSSSVPKSPPSTGSKNSKIKERKESGGHQKLFGGRMEFLPLMFMSDFCAILVLCSFWRIFRIVGNK